MKITMHAYDVVEMDFIREAALKIEAHREARDARRAAEFDAEIKGLQAEAAGVKHGEHMVIEDEVPSKAELVAEAAQLIRGAAVIDTPPAPDAPKVTMADMEAAAQASLKARQLVGTRAIIDTIAPGKRISEIDQALWPELLEKLKVVA